MGTHPIFESDFDCLTEMALTDPDSYNWLFHQKLIHSNSNFLPKLDKVDKSFYADYSNGIINRQNGKIAESLSCFRSLLKKDQLNRIELLEATSRSLLLVGRYKQAAESLQHIKKMRNSPNSKHHLNLGQCYKSAGVKAQAFDELERSINLNPNDSNLFEMAEFMLQDDKRDEAIRYLRQGLEIYPDSPTLNMKLGILLADLLIDSKNSLKIEDTNAATACLSMACRVEPESLIVLGSLLQLAQSDESIRHYREYFSVNPTSFELWNNLGLLSHQKHKKLASIACFRRAVCLNPIDSVAWLNLALLYLHNGQLISALNAINSTLALSRDSMAFDVFGLVLMLLGQVQNARKAFSKASKLRKTEPKIDKNKAYSGIYNRAVCYYPEPTSKQILEKELNLEKVKEKKLDPKLFASIQSLHQKSN